MRRKWWKDRNRKRILMMGAGVLLVALTALICVGPRVVAQPGPGGGPGRMQALMFLDRSWAAVNFEVKATPDQLEKLHPAYQTAWDESKTARKKAVETQDRQVLIDATTKIQADLEAKLKEVLTEEQQAQLRQWQEFQAQRIGQREGGGGAQP